MFTIKYTLNINNKIRSQACEYNKNSTFRELHNIG